LRLQGPPSRVARTGPDRVGPRGFPGTTVWRLRPPPPHADPAPPGHPRGDGIPRFHDGRRQRPGDATVPYRLGTLYSEKGWHAEAIAAYLKAMELAPKYKSDPKIIGTLIDALGDERTRDNARAVLTKRMGAAALPLLRAAARSSKSPAVRQEAAAVADEIGRAP